MLTISNDRLLLTEAQINTEYSKTEFVLGALQMLIGSYLILAFTLPAINQQGQERERDINIALWTMFAAQVINLLMKVLESTKAFSDKSRNKLTILFNHFRAATLDVGVILTFLRSMAALLAETNANNPGWFTKSMVSLSNWLSGESSGIRAGIALVLIGAKTVGSYVLTNAEFSVIKTQGRKSLLLRHEMNHRPWNRYTRMRWAANFFGSFIYQYVFSILPLVIIEDFDIPLNNQFKQIFPIVMGALAALFNLIPDHPFVSKYETIQLLKKILRFMDKFFRFGMRNLALLFMFHMNIISFRQKEEDVNVRNSTAATTLLAYFFLSCYLSEVYYRIVSVLNDVKITVSPLLKTWDFAAKMSKGIVVWAKMFAGNLYTAIPIMTLAVMDFITDFFDINNFSNWKKIAAALPESLNHGLFNTSLLLQLAKLEHLSWPFKSAIIIPFTVFFTITRTAAKTYPALNKLLEPVDYSLLGSGLFNGLQYFSNLFGKSMPAMAEYFFLGLPMTLSLSYSGYECIAARRKKRDEVIIAPEKDDEIEKNIQVIPVDKQKHSTTFFSQLAQPTKAAAFTDKVSAVFVLLIGFAMFNKAMQSYDEGNTAVTGVGLMIALIAICAALKLHTARGNFSYKNSSKQNCLIGYDVFGLCKKPGREGYQAIEETKTISDLTATKLNL